MLYIGPIYVIIYWLVLLPVAIFTVPIRLYNDILDEKTDEEDE